MKAKSEQLNPRAAELAAIKDPVERAARCQEFLTVGRETIRQVERIRDGAIREAREARRGTIDQLADAIKAKRNVIVNALRGAK